MITQKEKEVGGQILTKANRLSKKNQEGLSSEEKF